MCRESLRGVTHVNDKLPYDKCSKTFGFGNACVGFMQEPSMTNVNAHKI